MSATIFDMLSKPPFTISSKALQKIREIRSEKGINDEYCLRLGVKPAGCGIASYIIGFDHREDTDDVFLQDGLKIIISKAQMLYLAGKKVDFVEDEVATGFVFTDQNK